MPVNTYMVTNPEPCSECRWYDAYVEAKRDKDEYYEDAKRLNELAWQLRKENERLKRQLQHCNCNPT